MRDITIFGEDESKTFHLDFKISGGVGGSYAALDLAGLDTYLSENRLSAVRLQTRWAAINADDCTGQVFNLCDSNPKTDGERKFLQANLDREVSMANEITRLHDGGQRVLGAVGSFHTRPQGLPALMRARGFTVEFVKKSE